MAGAMGAVRAPLRLRLTAVALCAGLLPVPAYCADSDEFARAERYLREGDVVRALPLLRRLADTGYAPAQVRLGELMDKAEENAIAADLYRKAAEQGDADGAYGLGAMYASGEGVKRDMREALRWMRVAAQQAHIPATHFLAQAYLSAEPELKSDPDYEASAVRWATRAAETGFVPAMDALAAAYRRGAFGLAPDPALAQAWEQRGEAARRAVASRPAPGSDKQR